MFKWLIRVCLTLQFKHEFGCSFVNAWRFVRRSKLTNKFVDEVASLLCHICHHGFDDGEE